MEKILVGTRVTAAERAKIGAAASFSGVSISQFLRNLIIPAATKKVAEASLEILSQTASGNAA